MLTIYQILCSSTSYTSFHLSKQSYEEQKEKPEAELSSLFKLLRASRWQGWNLNPGPAISKACAFTALQASFKSQPQKQ